MAETIRGINVQIGSDTSGLSKALSDVNKNARDIQSELRQVERLLKFDPSNTELLAQKQKLLGDAVANTQEKLARLKSVQEQVNEQFEKGEISEGQYRAYQREVAKTEQNLQSLEAQLKEMGPATKDLGEQFEQAGEKMKKAGEKMTDAGKKLTTRVSAPIVALGGIALKTGMDFEASMSEVAAISGATGDDLVRLTEKAKEMGATTKFSASESAEALKYMAMAGWGTEQMLGALEGVMLLAAASGEDLGTVSDIVTDSMTAFGLSADQAAEFADVLAAASSKSNTNVSMLGQSFKYAAPVAGALGYSVEDTAIALGLMANAGIKSSQSGTALRTALTNLVNPTEKMSGVMEELGISITDNEGEMLSLGEIMEQLRDKFGGLDKDQQAAYASMLFGKEAMSGMLAIINTTADDYDNLAESIYNSGGAAKQMSDTMQDNAKGGLVQLQSAIEGIAIQLSEILIPIFNELVAWVQKAVDWFGGLDENTQKTIVTIAGLVAAIGPLLMIFGSMSKGIGSIVGVFGRLIPMVAGATAGIGGLSGVLAVITGPIGIAVAAIAALTAGGIALYKHLKEDSIPEIERFGEEVSETTQEAVGAFMDLNDQATLALNQLAWSGQEVTQEMAEGIAGTFAEMGAQVLASMEESHAEELASMQSFLASAKGMTEEEQAEILSKVQQSQNDQRAAVEEAQNEIKNILETASAEKRALTAEEAAEINQLQQGMLNTGIEMMSENELEQKAIMERMKANATDLTARQAAEVVQNSIKQRDESIQAAEDQYNDVVKQIIRQRDELGIITEEQADALIKEAQRQKDESINNAREMHRYVVSEAQKQAEEHVNKVDWETGEVKTKWQVLKGNVSKTLKDMKNNALVSFSEKFSGIKGKMSEIGESIKEKWIEIIGWLKGLGSKMVETGKDIMDGLKNGIKNAASSVWETTKDVGRGIADSVTGFFGIKSPSRLMMGYGEDIGDGLALGIKGSISDVERQVSALNAAASELDATATAGTTGTVATQAQSGRGGDLVQHITINSPAPLTPSDIARKNMQASRQLAMEWGMR